MGWVIFLCIALVPPALLMLVPEKAFPAVAAILFLLAAIVAVRSLTLSVGCQEFECVGAAMGFGVFGALALPSTFAGLIRWSRIRRNRGSHDQ